MAIQAALPALALALLSAAALGQAALPAPDPHSGTTTLHINTDLIQLPVLALRVPFRIASGLDSGSFTVRLDEGPPFHPTYTRVEGNEPVSLSILVDADSGGAEQLSESLQAAFQRWPAELLHPADHVSLYLSGCRLMRSLWNAPADLSARREALVRAASLPNFQKALEHSSGCPRPPIDRVLGTVMFQDAEPHAWRVILLLLNGQEAVDARAAEQLRGAAATQGATLFAVTYPRHGGFFAPFGSADGSLTTLVNSLGGINYASSFADLGKVMKTVLHNTRERYILSFPRPSNGSAGTHRIAVTTKARGVRLFPSAVSAPPPDAAPCGDSPCMGQRPQYGAKRPTE